MTRICPASRQHQELRIDIAAAPLPERVVLTLRIRDQLGTDHCLETLLTSLEARKLAHALLDANASSAREWPVSIVPAHPQDPPRSLVIRLAGGETYAIGHGLLLAANPSRSTLEDD